MGLASAKAKPSLREPVSGLNCPSGFLEDLGDEDKSYRSQQPMIKGNLHHLPELPVIKPVGEIMPF